MYTETFYEFKVQRFKKQFTLSDNKPVNTPHQAANALKNLIQNADREHFFCVYFDVANKIIGYEIVAIGGLHTVEVHPREVFKGAILAGAAAVIIAHNHPSNQCAPSKEDQSVYERFRDCGTLLGIPVLDQLILTESQFYSTGCKETFSL